MGDKIFRKSIAKLFYLVNKNEWEDMNNRLIRLEKDTNSLKEKIFDGYGIIDYEDFENRFRGSIETIKDRQKEYLKYIPDNSMVIDLGCGRGEFLELLRDENIKGKGVDLYEPYVQKCQRNGLEVECGDAIDYLTTLDDNSVGAIFAFQVIEHITYQNIIDIMQLSRNKLVDGGILVMETPNPMSLFIFTHAFYMDPTHTKPIHPLTLQYLAEKNGYKDTELLFTKSSIPEGYSVLNIAQDDAIIEVAKPIYKELFGSQDYALVARK